MEATRKDEINRENKNYRKMRFHIRTVWLQERIPRLWLPYGMFFCAIIVAVVVIWNDNNIIKLPFWSNWRIIEFHICDLHYHGDWMRGSQKIWPQKHMHTDTLDLFRSHKLCLFRNTHFDLILCNFNFDAKIMKTLQMRKTFRFAA